MDKWLPFAVLALLLLVIFVPWILIIIGIFLVFVLLVNIYYNRALPPPYLGMVDASTLRLNWVVPQSFRTVLELIDKDNNHYIIDPHVSPHQIIINEFTGDYQVISTQLSGLNPGQKYRYYIWQIRKNPTVPITTLEFCNKRKLFGGYSYYFFVPTPEFLDRPLRVAVLGDLQPREVIPPIFQWWVFRQIRRENVDLVLFLGDHTMEGVLPHLWRWFLHLIGGIARNTLVFGVPGNHDIQLRRNGQHVHIQDAYKTYIAYPDPKVFYGIHLFGLHLIALNFLVSCTLDSEQGSFVQKQLQQRNPSEWLITLWHTSPHNSLEPDSNVREMRAELEPLIRNAGGKIWFGGHEHSYQRYSVNGVEFITTAATSSFHHHHKNFEYQTKLIMKYHHCLLEITPNALKLSAITFGGKIIDEFTIPSP
jgi:hypothetical protein